VSYQLHHMTVDTTARAISVDGTVLQLRPQGYQVLEFLAAHPGHVHSRGVLLRALPGLAPRSERVIDAYVARGA